MHPDYITPTGFIIVLIILLTVYFWTTFNWSAWLVMKRVANMCHALWTVKHIYRFWRQNSRKYSPLRNTIKDVWKGTTFHRI